MAEEADPIHLHLHLHVTGSQTVDKKKQQPMEVSNIIPNRVNLIFSSDMQCDNQGPKGKPENATIGLCMNRSCFGMVINQSNCY